MAGFVLSVLLSVASAGILFHALGVVGSGQYVLIISVVGVTMGLTDAGLGGLAARELSVRPHAEHLGVLQGLLGLRLTLAMVGVGLACGYVVAAGFDGTMILGTLLVCAAGLLQGVQVVGQTSLSISLRFVPLTVADVARQAATTAGIFAITAAGGGLVAFCMNLVAASAISLGVVAAFAALRRAWLPVLDFRLWRDLAASAVPYALAAAAALIYLRLGVIFVDRLANPEETGYFGVSARIIEVLIMAPQLLAQSSLPVLARARDDADRLLHGMRRLLVLCWFIAVPVTLTLTIGAPLIIDVLAPDDAGPAASVLRWHAFALLGSFVAAPISACLLALGLTRAILAQTVIALIVVLSATPTLIQLDGARGAALAAVLAELTFAVVGWVLLAHAGHRVRSGLGELPKLLAAGAVASSTAFFLPPGPAVVGALAVFVMLSLALKSFPVELREVLRNILRLHVRR